MTAEQFKNYIKISADEGFVLTKFQKGDDILNYTYAKVMYSPLNSDYSYLREITEEENQVLLKEQENKIRELKY